jgi:hypothetical protein
MMDIDLRMEGVLDRRVADAIRRRLRMVRRQFATSGEWRVAVCPSEIRGEWDVGVQAPSGWHLNSFTDAIDGLPAFIERTLRGYLQLSNAQANAG